MLAKQSKSVYIRNSKNQINNIVRIIINQNPVFQHLKPLKTILNQQSREEKKNEETRNFQETKTTVIILLILLTYDDLHFF